MLREGLNRQLIGWKVCNWTSWTTLNRSLSSAGSSSLSFLLPTIIFFLPNNVNEFLISVSYVPPHVREYDIYPIHRDHHAGKHKLLHSASEFYILQERLIHSSILKSRKYVLIWLWLNVHNRINQMWLRGKVR